MRDNKISIKEEVAVISKEGTVQWERLEMDVGEASISVEKIREILKEEFMSRNSGK